MTHSYGMLLQPLLSTVDTQGVPFGSVFGIVEPLSLSKPHRHHDGELFIILSGEGVVEIDDKRHAVRTGDAILIPPFGQHSLENTSAADPLEMISIYWDDEASTAEAARHRLQASIRPEQILCPPPTPNGNLHLGHVAGPYLRADVYRRARTNQGIPSVLATGTDDHQSYVELKALAAGEETLAVATTYGDRIMQTLQSLDIEVAQSIRPAATRGYRDAVDRAFQRLCTSDDVKYTQLSTAYCSSCDNSLYQAYITGRCPTCECVTSGEICESCGFPNHAIELIDARCSKCGGPASQRTEAALTFALSGYADQLRTYHYSVKRNVRAAALVERLLEAGLPDYRLTRMGAWGLPVARPGLEGHVIDVWVELMLGQGSILDASGFDLIQFLGYDNSFFYAVLFPIISFALDDIQYRPRAFILNEFLELDGKKFSTSQDHAIWADEIASVANTDVLRLAMLQQSPEVRPESISRTELESVIDGAVVEPIEAWLGGYQALSTEVGGIAPTPGAWTSGQRAFLADLQNLLERYVDVLSLDRFCARDYAETIFDVVRLATDFRDSMRSLAGVEALKEELRTAQALDLLAARIFAIVASPAMPKATARLYTELGLQGLPRHEPRASFLPAGTSLSFAAGTYFPRPL